jgi:5-methylcytosine-specific restriction endonuclease McrA
VAAAIDFLLKSREYTHCEVTYVMESRTRLHSAIDQTADLPVESIVAEDQAELNQVDLSQQVLRTDLSGMPIEWIDYRDAVRLYHTEQVAYTCGVHLYAVHGGINSRTGERSVIDVNSIIATTGKQLGYDDKRRNYTPPLNNRTLFRRDANVCMYCGIRFMSRDLTRDHITPLSQRGNDVWQNVVAACKRCNNHKGGCTPEQAGMQLAAVPFVPTYAEYIYLKGRRVLADQMEFLLAHFPRSSPLHARLREDFGRNLHR